MIHYNMYKIISHLIMYAIQIYRFGGFLVQTIINHRDPFLISKDRITLTQAQLHIPGLRMMGHHNIYHVLEPLSWQYHENAFEISVTAKGTFHFRTRKKQYSFSRGDVFISFPNEVHSTDQTPVSTGELYWFQLDISQQDQFLFLEPAAAQELIRQLTLIPHHVVHSEISVLLPLLKNAFDAALAGKDPHLVASYIVLFLHLLLSYVERESLCVSINMLHVLDYIHDNITNEISLEHLASIANLSCSQFKQNFKKELGTSPRHYINQHKIDYAKDLLLEGKTVTETAMLLGFSSSNYFSSVFKKYTLQTPLEYVHEQQ